MNIFLHSKKNLEHVSVSRDTTIQTTNRLALLIKQGGISEKKLQFSEKLSLLLLSAKNRFSHCSERILLLESHNRTNRVEHSVCKANTESNWRVRRCTFQWNPSNQTTVSAIADLLLVGNRQKLP